MFLRRIHHFPFVFVWAAVLYGEETPIPEAPSQWVTDTANFLSPESMLTLNARLSEYQQATGHQLIVYIAPTTGDAPIEDWAVRAFAKWKVGRKGLDDGLALFIMPQDGKIRIEVGYGLEAIIPDTVASRLINGVMVPRTQAGQRDEAITAAIDSLTGVIGKIPRGIRAAGYTLWWLPALLDMAALFPHSGQKPYVTTARAKLKPHSAWSRVL